MKYSDISQLKNTFIFELDDVLYPEKDYLYQVYYLFAALLEYTELISAKETTDFMVNTYLNEGKDVIFDRLKEKLNLNEKFRYNLNNLLITAKLPLKLLLYQNMLTLLQEIVVDRKKIFIVTNGIPAQQLNKIKQTEWHGLEKYLVAYFPEEKIPKSESDVIDELIVEYNLQRREMVMIGNGAADSLSAESCGIDYINVKDFL